MLSMSGAKKSSSSSSSFTAAAAMSAAQLSSMLSMLCECRTQQQLQQGQACVHGQQSQLILHHLLLL
jgi:hypothetical protein